MWDTFGDQSDVHLLVLCYGGQLTRAPLEKYLLSIFLMNFFLITPPPPSSNHAPFIHDGGGVIFQVFLTGNVIFEIEGWKTRPIFRTHRGREHGLLETKKKKRRRERKREMCLHVIKVRIKMEISKHALGSVILHLKYVVDEVSPGSTPSEASR